MRIAEEVAKSIWQEVGQDVFKRAVTTFVGESVKAVVEIAKKRKLRMDQFEFQQWKADQTAVKSEKKSASKEAGSSEPSVEVEVEVEPSEAEV